MKTIIILVGAALLAACSMRDTVDLDGVTTTQAYDLSDADRDGVIEARERCAGTAVGAQINNVGCGQTKTVHERKDINILFTNGSAYIAPEYYPQIEEVAVFLRQHPNAKVTVEGHTSRTGNDERNTELSQARADAVVAVLSERFSIDSSRLSAIGYGSSRPLVMEYSPEAEIRNRRVVAEVSGGDSAADLKWTIYSVDDTSDDLSEITP